MKRYLHILWSFFKTSFMAETEFRFSFSVFLASTTLWVFLNLASINLLFGQVDSIAGWGKYEVMLLVCVRALFNSLLGVFMFPNLAFFHDMIREGQLDFVLAKPVSSRFWVSTRRFEFDQAIRLIVLVVLISFFLSQIGHVATFADWLSFLFFLLIGVAIFYNVCFLIVTTNFWLVDTFNLDYLFDSMQSVGQYPSTIFKGGIRLAMVFLIPTIFVSFFPTLALLGKTDLGMYVLAFAFLAVTSVLSQKFWNFALKNYSSASS